LGTWGAVQKIPAWVEKLTGDTDSKAIAGMLLGAGAVVGCLIAPFVGARVGRRPAYFLLCLASVIACAVLFRGFYEVDAAFWLMTFIVGGVTAAFYGWMPLYLPELFPTRIRATSQGVAYNFGRIVAAGGAFAGGGLVAVFHDYRQMLEIVSLIYVGGLVAIWFGPETKGKPLPD
jgi:MFS family permease